MTLIWVETCNKLTIPPVSFLAVGELIVSKYVAELINN